MGGVQLAQIKEELNDTSSNNAYPRFSSNYSFLAANSLYIIPPKPQETYLNSCQYASDPADAGGDPVNGWDPSGMGHFTTSLDFGEWYLYSSGNITEMTAIVSNLESNPLNLSSGGEGMDIQFCFDGPNSEAMSGFCKPNGWIPNSSTSSIQLLPDFPNYYPSAFDQASSHLFSILSNAGNKYGYSVPMMTSIPSPASSPGPSDPPDCGEACQPDPNPVGTASEEAFWRANSSAANCLDEPSSSGTVGFSASPLDYTSGPNFSLTIKWQGDGTVNVGNTATLASGAR